MTDSCRWPSSVHRRRQIYRNQLLTQLGGGRRRCGCVRILHGMDAGIQVLEILCSFRLDIKQACRIIWLKFKHIFQPGCDGILTERMEWPQRH